MPAGGREGAGRSGSRSSAGLADGRRGGRKGACTCLWVEDLGGQVRRRGPGGEVFVAVGDEGRQRMHVVGVLHNGDFVGLREGKEQEILGLRARI